MTTLDQEMVAPVGAAQNGGPKSLSPTARRALVAVMGGLIAFGGGAGVAFAFRVSPDVTATDPADMTVQDELPSIAAARAYALNNPPSYAPPVKAEPDVAVTAAAPAPFADEDPAMEAKADDDQPPPEDATPTRPQPYAAAFDAGAAPATQSGGGADPS